MRKERKLVRVANRRARHDYELLKGYTAGLVLTGDEVKSIRQGGLNLGDSYCVVDGGEMIVKGMHISRYKDCGYTGKDYDEKQDRKLLLKKAEILELDGGVTKKGYTIVPVELYENEKGFMKLKICLAHGKKDFDKRESLKERDIERELRRDF